MLSKKIDSAKYFIEKNIDFFQCPICGSAFNIKNYSVICENNHTYDISKKGYINLFNGQTKLVKIYDKPLFSARKTVSDCGLYDNLCKQLARIINDLRKDNEGSGAVLDAGCGGGNVTSDIFKSVFQNDTGVVPYSTNSFFALDLSKDGIDFAASNFFDENSLWLVGNLNNMPFKDKKFDVILNVMSPANYSEFKRVMRDGGAVLKVLPEADYLKELRRFIYRENDHNEYSNSEVMANIEGNMSVADTVDISYTHRLNGNAAAALFDMTPLTANADKQIRDEFVAQHESSHFDVTLAFKIVILRV